MPTEKQVRNIPYVRTKVILKSRGRAYRRLNYILVYAFKKLLILPDGFFFSSADQVSFTTTSGKNLATAFLPVLSIL